MSMVYGDKLPFVNHLHGRAQMDLWAAAEAHAPGSGDALSRHGHRDVPTDGPADRSGVGPGIDACRADERGAARAAETQGVAGTAVDRLPLRISAGRGAGKGRGDGDDHSPHAALARARRGGGAGQLRWWRW